MQSPSSTENFSTLLILIGFEITYFTIKADTLLGQGYLLD